MWASGTDKEQKCLRGDEQQNTIQLDLHAISQNVQFVVKIFVAHIPDTNLSNRIFESHESFRELRIKSCQWRTRHKSCSFTQKRRTTTTLDPSLALLKLSVTWSKHLHQVETREGPLEPLASPLLKRWEHLHLLQHSLFTCSNTLNESMALVFVSSVWAEYVVVDVYHAAETLPVNVALDCALFAWPVK